MSGLAEAFAQLAKYEEQGAPKIPHFGQIARLRDFAERFKKGHSFEVGQIVTPTSDSPYRGAGEPHLVIEVLKEPVLPTQFDPSSNTFGARYDVRVASVSVTGATVMHWLESVYVEPYVEK